MIQVHLKTGERDREMIENVEIRAFVEKLDMMPPLESRDSFYGGRTETFQMFKESCSDEQIEYFDVTSLSPHTKRNEKVHVGHP